MSRRTIFTCVALAATSLAAAGLPAAPAAAATTTCTWGGTPLAPPGTFTISPGITNLPASEALKFKATGELAGDAGCAGTMTFAGQIDAGSNCRASSFEGGVKGLPGVTRYWGKGSLMVPELLYDAPGNVVGSDQPEIMTPENGNMIDCDTAGGFTAGTFASTRRALRVAPCACAAAMSAGCRNKLSRRSMKIQCVL